jgi:hypothetical protein
MLHGNATLRLASPFRHSGTSLRGAVVASLFPGDHKLEHVDWHQHMGDQKRQTPAPILYRVHNGTPHVFAWGEFAHQHLRYLAGHIEHLTTREGRRIGIKSVDLALGSTDVGLHKEQWYRYEFASPLHPSHVAWVRRPRRPGEARKAWAGLALAGSVRLILGVVGIEPQPHRPIHIHWEHCRDRRVVWRGKQARWGFDGIFWSNAILPDGHLGHNRDRSEAQARDHLPPGHRRIGDGLGRLARARLLGG